MMADPDETKGYPDLRSDLRSDEVFYKEYPDVRSDEDYFYWMFRLAHVDTEGAPQDGPSKEANLTEIHDRMRSFVNCIYPKSSQ